MTEILIDDKVKAGANPERVLRALSVFSTVFTLGWLLWFSRYGIELTDEGFYLVWISNPFNYSVSATQFGFIYYPLYELLNGNIAALRQANILITFTLAWTLCNVALKTIFETHPLESTHRLIISAALATSSLLILTLWLPTPSYNSLALQALLIAATGLLLAQRKASIPSVTGWLLIGIGGWLAFMAKPTTAAALGVCSIIYLLVAEKLGSRLLVIPLVTGMVLLALSALAIDGSISGFIDRLKGGAEAGKALGGGHTAAQMLRVDNFYLRGKAKILLILGSVLFASASYLTQSKSRPSVYGGTLLTISFVLSGLAIGCGLTSEALNAGPFQGLLIWTVPFAGILVSLALTRFQVLLHVTRGQWAMALGFMVFPHIYAFGTGNNYWSAGASAGIFWTLAGLALLGPVAATQKLSALLLPLALAAQLVTVIQVDAGIKAPYRQPPLRANNHALDIGKPGSRLMLSEGFSRYLSEAMDLASQARLKQGTPMLDMSGQSPGTLYALGAKSIGQAWVLGGYPGSQKLATINLRRVPCEEIARLWLLTEPGGPREIPSTVLDSLGMNASRDFEIVGELHTPRGAGGYMESRLQQVLRPVRSLALAQAACEQSRVNVR